MTELEVVYRVWPYLLPPLAGALIGYFTNYLAIRMLFRPLKPWHFLGLKLPLTPGIIPAPAAGTGQPHRHHGRRSSPDP